MAPASNSPCRLQLRDLTARVEAAARAGHFSVEAFLPLMYRRRLSAGETLCVAGEPAHGLFYVLDGAISLPAVQRTVGAGNFLGEFGLFSDEGLRTGSAVACTDSTIMVLTRSAVFACLLQHPELGVHLLRLITGRMLQNAGLGGKLLEPPASTEHDATGISPSR